MCARWAFTASAVTFSASIGKSSSRNGNSDRMSVSPLSPARQWARLASFRFTASLYCGCGGQDLPARDECRDDPDTVAHLPPEAAAASGPVGRERFHFPADALGVIARLGASGDTQPHFVRIVGVTESRVMRGVDADQIDA